MCPDQWTEQMPRFKQSKVTYLAKIESDIVLVDRPRMMNKLNV